MPEGTTPRAMPPRRVTWWVWGSTRQGSLTKGCGCQMSRHPRQPQENWGDRCSPVGFGALSRSWQPRAGYAGTYDAMWQAEQFPLLPHDFDDRYYQCAPQDQWLPRLEAGEPVLLRNLSPEGELRLEFRPFECRCICDANESRCGSPINWIRC